MGTQVLIVGAGPVGLTMASELARYGISVRIVDKAAQRTDKSKALVLWSRTLELLDRAGCTETFIAAGHKVLAANIIAATKVIGHLDMSIVDSPYPFALMLPQSETERLLEEHLNRLGVNVERQVEVTSFIHRDDGVSVTLQRPNGDRESLEAEWMIGCDGAHSTVRHGLGLSFLGETLQSNWILADIHLAGYPFPASEIATYWHQDGVLVVFPVSPNRFRVIADVDLAAGVLPAEPSLDEVQQIIDERGPGGIVASAPIWLSAFRINERKVGDYRSGRVFVAGDAAHVHSPAGGQGMNTGMQDAINLAWKLALVCQKSCSDEILNSYSTERSAVGQQVLAAAGRLTAVAVMRNHVAQTVRNLLGHVLFGLTSVRRAIANTMTEVSVGYQHTPLNGPDFRGHSGPVPGERVRPIDGQSPVGSGAQPRFTLFAESTVNVRHLPEMFDSLIDPEVRAPLSPGAMWLVRPDGYVACVAEDGDTKVIVDYLDNIRGASPSVPVPAQ